MESEPIHLTKRSKDITFTHGMTDANAIRFYTTKISFDFLYEVVREGVGIHTLDKKNNNKTVYHGKTATNTIRSYVSVLVSLFWFTCLSV